MANHFDDDLERRRSRYQDRDLDSGYYDDESRFRSFSDEGEDFDTGRGRFGRQGEWYVDEYGQRRYGGTGSNADRGRYNRGNYQSGFSGRGGQFGGRQYGGSNWSRSGSSFRGGNYGDQGSRGSGQYGEQGYRGAGYYGDQYSRGSGNFGGESWQGNRGYDQDNLSDADYGTSDNEPGWIAYSWTDYYLIPGPFVGQGPQGYNRSDDRIRDDINDRLMMHGHIDARNMNISVNNGEVTLSGMVNDRRAKRLAEDVVEAVPGVREVRNELSVRRQNEQFNRGQQWNQGEQFNRGQQRNQGTSGQTGELEREQHWQSGERSSTSHENMGSTGTTASSQYTTTGQESMASRAGAGAATVDRTKTTGTMSGVNRSQLRAGMEVVGSQGSSIGQIKEVRDNDFLIDRPMARDVYAPFNAVQNVSGNRITLNIPADRIDSMNWENPPIGGDDVPFSEKK